MKIGKIGILIILLLFSAAAQTDGQGIAETPPMGWLSWNLFEGDINEKLVREIADAMVVCGMKEAGYQYVILDDLWQGGRNERGEICPDPV